MPKFSAQISNRSLNPPVLNLDKKNTPNPSLLSIHPEVLQNSDVQSKLATNVNSAINEFVERTKLSQSIISSPSLPTKSQLDAVTFAELTSKANIPLNILRDKNFITVLSTKLSTPNTQLTAATLSTVAVDTGLLIQKQKTPLLHPGIIASEESGAYGKGYKTANEIEDSKIQQSSTELVPKRVLTLDGHDHTTESSTDTPQTKSMGVAKNMQKTLDLFSKATSSVGSAFTNLKNKITKSGYNRF